MSRCEQSSQGDGPSSRSHFSARANLVLEDSSIIFIIKQPMSTRRVEDKQQFSGLVATFLEDTSEIEAPCR